jgi:hypothetical protein
LARTGRKAWASTRKPRSLPRGCNGISRSSAPRWRSLAAATTPPQTRLFPPVVPAALPAGRKVSASSPPSSLRCRCVVPSPDTLFLALARPARGGVARMPHGHGCAKPTSQRPALVVTGAVSPPAGASPRSLAYDALGSLRRPRDSTRR